MRTNADRAARAEAALLAYIDATGDARTANEVETWISDLLCDLRHFCKFMGIEFNPHAGAMNFECETSEDEDGDFTPENDEWHSIADKTPVAAEGAASTCADCGGIVGYDAWVDSKGEVCGGPFQQSQCMSCERENPPVAGGNQ